MVALNGGRPELMNLQGHAHAPSSPSARRSSPGAPSSCSTRRATAPTCWSASPSPSPISTRSSASSAPRPIPTAARERADGAATGRRGDIAPLIALIDDPRHRDQRGRHLPPVRGAGARHPRAAPAAPDRRSAATRSPTSCTKLAGRDRATISTSCARARRIMAIVTDELAEVRDALRHAAPHRDRRLATPTSRTRT